MKCNICFWYQSDEEQLLASTFWAFFYYKLPHFTFQYKTFRILKTSFKQISFSVTASLPLFGKSAIKITLVESFGLFWLVVGFSLFNLVKMSFFVKSFSSKFSKQKPLLTSKVTKCKGAYYAWEDFPKMLLEWQNGLAGKKGLYGPSGFKLPARGSSL